MAIVVLRKNCGREVIALCIFVRCLTVAWEGNFFSTSPLVDLIDPRHTWPKLALYQFLLAGMVRKNMLTWLMSLLGHMVFGWQGYFPLARSRGGPWKSKWIRAGYVTFGANAFLGAPAVF